MEKESIKNRLAKILNNATMLKEIVFSSDPIVSRTSVKEV